jgi:hypothetical protein
MLYTSILSLIAGGLGFLALMGGCFLGGSLVIVTGYYTGAAASFLLACVVHLPLRIDLFIRTIIFIVMMLWLSDLLLAFFRRRR